MRIEEIRNKLKSIQELKTVDDILAGIKERKKALEVIDWDLNEIDMRIHDAYRAGKGHFDYLNPELERNSELRRTVEWEIIVLEEKRSNRHNFFQNKSKDWTLDCDIKNKFNSIGMLIKSLILKKTTSNTPAFQ